jgi:hypothetical protein
VPLPTESHASSTPSGEAWGANARIPAETWEVPILAQFGGIDLSDGVIAQVVAALGSTVRPVLNRDCRRFDDGQAVGNEPLKVRPSDRSNLQRQALSLQVTGQSVGRAEVCLYRSGAPVRG